ncbi:TetR/AcrR family transcriptional regulator [Xenorhabdus griffiniae]|uniref:TetR/AcrR family transcriptional regulator n=2 Tax=Xenorhabdus griffiniae TaxID=351672 RepID=A0ABY9XFY6_9GAMM|nr:TetR/AcrR family transcriptional regulator [Xenorhabdus griffiniae]MBD1228472.1 TetR/AcrR family transcriptional regulator [Xenorhabdus griffiniae]MBE8588633.1 TetR/AcrR family transcriptional regulator [Xenorhabdus griffiniae]WMV71841.1 TetR/AcrR family transcriptional regulator [Xenorhabdus griffiniae]WNH01518.1 TetR/AcrR family transcriptional regulator [Xenorhabdus griffiniae]
MAENHPRPRGRPTIPEQVMRQKILDVTFLLLINQGYNKTTMDVVAKKAGIAKKTLYRFAKNREDLLEQVVMGWEDNFIPAFKKDANNFQQLMKSLKIFLTEIAEKTLSMEAVGLFKLLQSDFPHREVLLSKYQQSGIEKSRNILANWLERQYQKELLKKMDFHIISELIISMVIAEPLRKMALGILPPLPETDMKPRINAAVSLLEYE